MNPKTETLGFLEDDPYRELQRWYRKYPIALYTGAGVSSACPSENNLGKGSYGISGWDDFLGEILAASPDGRLQWLREFETDVKIRFKNRPWESADWVARRVGKKQFEQCVVKLIQRLDNFPESRQPRLKSGQKERKSKKYKQLGRPFLDAAPTLKALCAFCGRLTALVKDADRNTYRVSPNPRVRAVVTTNYDPFLEAASSTMYIRHLLKPVAARGSAGGSLHEIPVFHVHGYVRYPERGQGGKQRTIVPMVSPVVTTNDYRKAWKQDSAYCFTMEPQLHVLRYYRTLFVGFSFRDDWVNNLLRKLKKEHAEHDGDFCHYALIKRSEILAKRPAFFESLGIKPIALECYSQIPECLGRLYQEGLKEDYVTGDLPLPSVLKTRAPKRIAANKFTMEGPEHVASPPGTSEDKPYRLAPAQYWEELCACRNCHVRHNSADT